MKKEFSIYLDLIRILAATMVFVHHMDIKSIYRAVGNLGDLGVIIFFVMSGCVIAFVTDQKEKTPDRFIVNRMARLYSVVLPTIVLVPALDLVGRSLGGVVYNNYPHDHYILRTVIALLFANEFWFQSVLMYTNVPYWSLSYEAWYYVLFGIIFFSQSKKKYAWAAILCLMVGPSILLLLPIWGLGILLYRVDQKQALPLKKSAALATLGLAGLVIFKIAGGPNQLGYLTETLLTKPGADRLIHAKSFLSHWVMGLLVFLHLRGMKSLCAQVKLFSGAEKPIRFLAKYTFELYLLHQPLMFFWTTVLWPDLKYPQDYRAALVAVLVLGSVWVIGHLTQPLQGILKTKLQLLGSRIMPLARSY